MSWDYWAILFLIFMLVTPAAQIGVSWARRRWARGVLERRRDTLVVPIVLSMNTVATYGLPVARFEQLPLPEEVAAAIGAAPPERPIDIVVDMPAGLRFDPGPVALAIGERSATTTLVVPRSALSGGLTLARAADRVLLGAEATVGDGASPSGDRPGAGGVDAPPAGDDERANVEAANDRAGAAGDAALDARGLRALGISVEEAVPDVYAEYLERCAGPQPPRRALPFFIRVPRTPD